MPFLPSLTQVPVLETERLLLRGCRIDDLPEFTAIWQEPNFYRFLGGKPQSEEEVWRRMLAQQGHWSLMGYGYWSVEEKSTGRFIGNVGFSDFNRDLTPSIKGIPEIGWVLAPRVHGLGYATEAVQAALAWGEQNFPNKQTVCIIDPENVASLRIAEKFGYKELARIPYKEQPILLLSR
ncbi:GNAT family N-acetyltransferase [Hymenobacter sp. GOD-10R]|uniref:GNAT family N-acetyltransferase n=1 Tax=Hymenobacter sp. GOD-10R TaxID=3093922 RepID=UPI002D7A15B5|nr:GNAT family N-acetyltransferase [Hymenobacter sp. GOD-10R]WRQ29101.1 GNAT family N-acetyltransferase [Hymenobacter sp. GOD-10R]